MSLLSSEKHPSKGQTLQPVNCPNTLISSYSDIHLYKEENNTWGARRGLKSNNAVMREAYVIHRVRALCAHSLPNGTWRRKLQLKSWSDTATRNLVKSTGWKNLVGFADIAIDSRISKPKLKAAIPGHESCPRYIYEFYRPRRELTKMFLWYSGEYVLISTAYDGVLSVTWVPFTTNNAISKIQSKTNDNTNKQGATNAGYRILLKVT